MAAEERRVKAKMEKRELNLTNALQHAISEEENVR